MQKSQDVIEGLRENIQSHFQKQRVILSYREFLSRLEADPNKLIRSSAAYLRDVFDYFGKETVHTPQGKQTRYKLFNQGTDRNGPIVGCESVQEEIYRILDSFTRHGRADKLILLHGPNGSAKSSTLECISSGMQRYSATDEGAVYCFNWIFPTEKSANPSVAGEAGPIGFGAPGKDGLQNDRWRETYATLDESKIACKIHAEFHDNPVYLIPMPQREELLRRWISAKEGIPESEVEIPPHILLPGLSKKNQLIFENLLASYDGDLLKVLRHVQVERFFYSRQYRVGIATVEPQMSIDAGERQLTMDKNIMNLPVFLNNIRFHEASGQLVEANRGILEFSDMLKRPLEAFKYLLTTVEKGTLSLPSSTANLDIVFFGTTNEKHLDAFKALPDFSSFRSRFELVVVPYLLSPKSEMRIYDSDLRALAKTKKVAPHSVECLCMWAVMTRLKQPDTEHYDPKHRGLIARLEPRAKVSLYSGESLQPFYKPTEEPLMQELRSRIYFESLGLPVYEGRFGASPREVRVILHRAAQNERFSTLTPMAVFSELRRLVRDKSVYEFLQFEPRGKYHDAERFIEAVEDHFANVFEHEVLLSMNLVADEQYELHLQRYIENVVAFIKKEKIYNQLTTTYEEPNASLMKDFETIIGVTGSVERHRQTLLSRIAGYSLNNPQKPVEPKVIFHDLLKKLQDHYHGEQKKVVSATFEAMLSLDNDEQKRRLSDEEALRAKHTFELLESRFGYDYSSARESLKFLMTRRQANPGSPN